MKGVIVVPKFYERDPGFSMGAVIKRTALYMNLCKRYNFSYLYTDTPNLDGYDVAIISSVPYHNRPSIPPGLLDAKCKLIGEFGDLQCWDSLECIKNKKILFDRYDYLIGGFYYKFREWYPEFVHKYFYWPAYFGPYENYVSLPINTNPIMRCLMIGTYDNPAYPRRQYVANKASRIPDRGGLDVVGNTVPFEQYPKYINNYFCGLALSAIYDLPEAKFFEIPAAGALMLATEVKELGIAGLEPNIHYVPVTKENVFDKIKEVLSNPYKYIEIRDSGTRLVRSNCSDINRLDAFKSIFNNVVPNGHEKLLR